MPIAIVNGVGYNVCSDSWRDALCSLINNIVKEAFAEEGKSINIIFENEDRLEISLRKEDYDGPEAAFLYEENNNRKLIVW